MKSFCLIAFSIIYLFYFASSLQAQSEHELLPKRTIIAGEVENFSDENRVLVVNYCNPINDDSRFALDLTETNGTFHAVDYYIFTTNLTIGIGNHFINVIVNPGDSIYLKIDANKVLNNNSIAIEFTGDNSELNSEFHSWCISASNKNYVIPQIDNNTPPDSFISKVNESFKIAEDSINSYSQRNGMSPFLQKWANINLRYTIANSFILYEPENNALWEIFTHSIFDVFNDDNLQSMYFPYHLDVCLSALIADDMHFAQLVSENNLSKAAQHIIDQIKIKVPAGQVRDVLLFRFLSKIIEQTPDIYSSLTVSDSLFTINYFNTLLNNKISNGIDSSINSGNSEAVPEAERTHHGIIFLEEGTTIEMPEIQLLQYLKEKYHGKVMYIDVWATWCAPCLQEFKVTPDLHQFFMDKEVVFVNLCLESRTVENWKNSIERHNIKGENYYLNPNISKLFKAENNIPGFPFYMLIDKNGNLHKGLPRPTELNLAIKTINSFLD